MPTDNQEPTGDEQETETGEEQGQAQDQGGQGAAAQTAQRPDTGSEDIALEDDEELDIEIAEVAPRRRSCGAPIAIVFVIAVLVAAALWGKSEWEKKQKELQANEERAFGSVNQSVDDSIRKASDLAKAGKVEDAFKALEAARGKLADASRTASTSKVAGAEDRAAKLLKRGQLLGSIIEDIDQERAEVAEYDKTIADLKAQIAEVEAKRGELEKSISDSITGLTGAPESSGSGGTSTPDAGAVEPSAPTNGAAPAGDDAAGATGPATAEPATTGAAQPPAPPEEAKAGAR